MTGFTVKRELMRGCFLVDDRLFTSKTNETIMKMSGRKGESLWPSSAGKKQEQRLMTEEWTLEEKKSHHDKAMNHQLSISRETIMMRFAKYIVY